jgi:hypothetical protein
LLGYGAGFEEALADLGYSAGSIGRHLRLMVHMSRWLAEQHLAASDLTVECARRFLRFGGRGATHIPRRWPAWLRCLTTWAAPARSRSLTPILQ